MQDGGVRYLVDRATEPDQLPPTVWERHLDDGRGEPAGANQMRVCRERVGATDDLGAE